MPPRRRKEQQIEIPDDTVTDLSAYLAGVAANMDKSAAQVRGSSGSSGSSGSPSSPERRRPQRREGGSDDWMQQWYDKNHLKVQDYDYIRFELLYFLSDYDKGINVDEDINPYHLVALVKDLFTELQTKFNRFNLELKEISGHEIAGYIQDHHRKVVEVVEDYEEKIKSANEELSQCKEHIAHLDGQLSAALTKLMYLEKGTAYYGGFEESVTEEQFMADLQSRVAYSETLCSSLTEELQREKQQREGLQSQLGQVAREKVQTQEKCMKEIVEFSKRAEIHSMLNQGIESMLQKGDKEPNSQDCQKLIDQWKTEINKAIDENSKEIDELMKKIEGQNKDMANLQAQARAQEEHLESMQIKVQKLRHQYDNYKETATNLRAEIDDIKKVMYDIHDDSLLLQPFMERYGINSETGEDTEEIEKNVPSLAQGKILEHDILGDTLPLRSRRRKQKRPVTPMYYSSTEPSSPERPERPIVGMGVVRLMSDDEYDVIGGYGRISPEGRGRTPSPQFRSSGRAGELGSSQYTTDGGRMIPTINEPPQRQPARGQVRYETRGGRLVPVTDQSTQEQTIPSGVIRLDDNQWSSIGGDTSQIPAPLHSTLQNQSQEPRARTSQRPNVSRIGTGRTSQRPDVSRIGTGRAPQRTEVSRIGTGRTPTRPDASRATTRTGLPLSRPRAGTSQRLGTSSMQPASSRPPQRVGRPAMRPSASRPGTPPRPRIPTQRTSTQRTARPTTASRTPQRSHLSSTQQTTEASSMMSRVMLLSPQRTEPLALDVEVAPTDIVTSQNQIVCEVSVGIQPAAQGQNAARRQRTRPPRPNFTPRSSFR